MSEVTIPLGLLLLGTAAILWEMVRGERNGRRSAHSSSLGAASEASEKPERTEASNGTDKAGREKRVEQGQ